MKKNANIAILLFSRSAKCESSFKHWTRDKNINFQIANHLISDTHKRLKTSPYPIVVVDEKLQSGNIFGEKLANAFDYVFQKGFDYVIAVGNDCSNISVNWRRFQII